MEDGTIKPPTPPLPGWNNGIIDPNLMWGSGKSLGKGASWLQNLQMYSILKGNGVDPDVFAKTIPEKYVARNYLDELPEGDSEENYPDIVEVHLGDGVVEGNEINAVKGIP